MTVYTYNQYKVIISGDKIIESNYAGVELTDDATTAARMLRACGWKIKKVSKQTDVWGRKIG